MTTEPPRPPPAAPTPAAPPVPSAPIPNLPSGQAPPSALPGREFFDRIRSFGAVRPDQGRWAAGVALAIARRAGVDPLLVRGLLVALAVTSGGIALLAYGLAWALLPQQDGSIHAQQVLRGDVRAGFVGAVISTLIGLGQPAPWLGLGWTPWGGGQNLGGLLTVGLVGLAIWWVLTRSSGNRAAPGPPPGEPASTGPRPVAPVPPAPALALPPPAPPAPDLSAPSHRLTQATLGTALVGAGALALTDRSTDSLPGSAWLVAGCTALAVIAVGIVAAGVLGLRAGGLAPIGVLLAIGVIAGSLLPTPGSFDGFGTRTWAPVSAAAAEPGIRLGAGQVTADLSRPGLLAGASTLTPVRVDASIGIGQLDLVVPPGTSAVIHASVGAGEVRSELTGSTDTGTQQSGPGIDRTIRIGTGEPVLVVEAGVGLGQIRVIDSPGGTR